ncbi:hypothetical protein DdX_15495 [Ditylenchus destructor]|uniref:Uncharacterized protein n=1 Tax=Ditylenchus destructor TaxID=166010 RepID=A0AAD4MQS1_9BILA|nr:hypothetical protein DdX_15495 [Ditylenchus destructor]
MSTNKNFMFCPRAGHWIGLRQGPWLQDVHPGAGTWPNLCGTALRSIAPLRFGRFRLVLDELETGIEIQERTTRELRTPEGPGGLEIQERTFRTVSFSLQEEMASESAPSQMKMF